VVFVLNEVINLLEKVTLSSLHAMSSTTWVGAYLVLCRLLQMVLDLTNQQFILLFVCGTALIFIVTSLTHTHDIDAEEIALKTADKVEKSLEKIT
jgi:hypothetical protein